MPQIRYLILILVVPLLTGAADINSEILAQFRQYTPKEFQEVLDLHRPAPVTPQFATGILASLPEQGEVRQLTSADVHKIESISAVLRAHQREGVYVVKVVASPQARIGLHARFVLLVTTTALRILSATQLQALVAHEIGHEYVWEGYNSARAKGNNRRMRSLELFCDGIAMLTLARIGVDPKTLVDALRLLEFVNRRDGLAAEYNSYPPLPDRADFARKISTWLDWDGSFDQGDANNKLISQGDKKQETGIRDGNRDSAGP